MGAESSNRPKAAFHAAARAPVALAAAVSGGIGILMLTVPIFSLQVFDRVLGSGSQETLLALTLVTAGALVTLRNRR